MNTTRYAVLAADVEHEVEVRRSRFVCRLHRVDDEAQARDAIAIARAEHRLARHHCSAFVVGPDRRIRRSNDDGEPAGTAGAPMLDALVRRETGLDGAELSDVVAVVIRYFGGVLLGAGGLVRAYSDAVSTALDGARLVARERRRVFVLEAPHADAGRWEHDLRAAPAVDRSASGIAVLDVDYGGREAALRLAVPDSPEAIAALERRVAVLTQGARTIHSSGTRWVDLDAD